MTIVVDVANVMGSRPDGWWRDRAGAAVRLHDQIARLAAGGQAGFVMVLEGAARAAAGRLVKAGRRAETGRRAEAGRRAETGPDGSGPVAPGEVRVVRARGSGDDAIVALVRELPGRRMVVTADRELRERSMAAGAEIAGPGWLLGQLDRG